MDIIFLTDYAEKAGCANKAISQNEGVQKGSSEEKWIGVAVGAFPPCWVRFTSTS